MRSDPLPRLLCGLLLLSSLVACSKAVPPPASPDAASPVPSSPAQAPNAETEDQALVAVSSALRRAGLLKRPDPCYVYRFDPAPSQTAATIDVRENHEHATCGGDPATQPHLFFVRRDRQTRALSDDARQAGRFEPLLP